MLPREGARNVCQIVIAPIVTWFGCQPCEDPESNTLGIHSEQLREALNRAQWLSAQPGNAVQKVLGCVVRRIADEGLGVYDKPRLSLGLQDIACVKVGCQQHVVS